MALGTFAYGGIDFEVDVLDALEFGKRIVRTKTGTLRNWLALTEAIGQRAIYRSGQHLYEVIIIDVQPQYDIEPKLYVGEVAAIEFEFALKDGSVMPKI
jgi:hypothetical protein